MQLTQEMLPPVGMPEVAHQLWANGPTWDGNIIDKGSRDWLHERGFVDRFNGFNWLTREGVILCIESGHGVEKRK